MPLVPLMKYQRAKKLSILEASCLIGSAYFPETSMEWRKYASWSKAATLEMVRTRRSGLAADGHEDLVIVVVLGLNEFPCHSVDGFTFPASHQSASKLARTRAPYLPLILSSCLTLCSPPWVNKLLSVPHSSANDALVNMLL